MKLRIDDVVDEVLGRAAGKARAHKPDRKRPSFDLKDEIRLASEQCVQERTSAGAVHHLPNVWMRSPDDPAFGKTPQHPAGWHLALLRAKIGRETYWLPITTKRAQLVERATGMRINAPEEKVVELTPGCIARPVACALAVAIRRCKPRDARALDELEHDIEELLSDRDAQDGKSLLRGWAGHRGQYPVVTSYLLAHARNLRMSTEKAVGEGGFEGRLQHALFRTIERSVRVDDVEARR